MKKKLNENKQKKNVEGPKFLTLTAAVIAILATIFVSLDKIFNSSIFEKFTTIFKYQSSWLWINTVLILIFTFLSIFFHMKIWKLNLFDAYKENFKKKRTEFFLRAAGSVMVQLLLVLLILLICPDINFNNNDAKILFPQRKLLGPVKIYSYASNGEVFYTFNNKTPVNGPNGYIEVTLKTFNNSGMDNCGLILAFVKGISLSRYSHIRFKIQKETGNEQIGFKVKDAKGVEISVLLNDYLKAGNIANEWQEADLPLSHFGNIDFGLMDNINFFITGNSSGTIPRKFRIGDFNFY